MIYIVLNFWPILAATVASWLFGSAYYGVFGKPWMAAAGLDESDIRGPGGKVSPVPFIVSFIAEFWIACILAGALILAPDEAGEWTMAIGTAIVIWIGFVMPVMLVNHLYQRRSIRLTAIDGGHWLGVFIVIVAVLQAIGLTPPPSA
ncbi:DUF1761 domain-containing protein [Parvularcula lutaonensis]|uniref:DUF1761 domain-containing protein n=1 Tax=Parvularcula lutaonensis TaxID=491923 RepID=A0ABV7MC39_9PROT|nr:DUF1761 domain-containing protein [Parvularcula lutaonensis]GGY49819.1 hypothetical protein GCM10007148_18090 [Parvularcula lutaonensis]